MSVFLTFMGQFCWVSILMLSHQDPTQIKDICMCALKLCIERVQHKLRIEDLCLPSCLTDFFTLSGKNLQKILRGTTSFVREKWKIAAHVLLLFKTNFYSDRAENSGTYSSLPQLVSTDLGYQSDSSTIGFLQ